MRTLTLRERRLITVGLLLLALAGLGFAVVGPLTQGFLERAEARRALAAAWRRNTRLIESLPALRVAAETQRRGAPRFTILAPDEIAAANALAARLRRLGAEEGFAVTATEPLQDDTPAGRVKVRADMTLTLTQAYETLRRLQSEDAYVIVDYFSVSAERSRAAGRLEPLDVRLEVSAAWRPGVGQR